MSFILHKVNIIIVHSAFNWIISYFVGVVILFIIIHLETINSEVLKKAYTFFLIAPLLESIYLEAYNILNQHNIILTYKTITIIAIYGICFLISCIYYQLNRKKELKFHYTKYYYPILLLIFTFIVSAIQMITKINTDFFESANHTLGIYEFFKYGKIPMIETYDAHMLFYQLYGIIYEIFNQDINSAIFCLYSSYSMVFMYMILYYFFKKIFPRDIAFIITIFFPLQNDGRLSNYYYMGLLPVILLINAYKKKTFRSFLLYWISLVFVCVYRLDVGFSISIATVIVLIYIWLKNKKNIKLKNILVPLVVVITICFVFYVGVCLAKNIDPVMRALEFIKLAMSNINWGYASLGDTESLAYTVCY